MWFGEKDLRESGSNLIKSCIKTVASPPPYPSPLEGEGWVGGIVVRFEMGKINVITGRGGTGKSTFTTLFGRYIYAKPLLIIDLDPDGSLAKMLGVDLEKEAKVTISDALSNIIAKGKDSKGKNDSPDLLRRMMEDGEILHRDKKFDLITLGTKFAPGCYCLPDEMIKETLRNIHKDYEIILVDSPAGLEHLNRKVTPTIDDLFVVLDPSEKSAKHIARIRYVTKGVNITYKNFYLVGNYRFTPLESSAIYGRGVDRKCPSLIAPGVKDSSFLTGLTNEAESFLIKSGEKYLGRIDYDPYIREYNLKGESLFKVPDDSPSSISVKKILREAGYELLQ
jgi:CO dehydrogenase maturation factor